MSVERSVKFFRNGRNQAVRIPRGWEMPGTDGIMRQEGQRLVIEPAWPKPDLVTLLDLWAREPPLDPEDDPFNFDDPPPEPVGIFDDEA